MHAAISTMKREQTLPMLAVVPATAPLEEIDEKQSLKKEKKVSFNLPIPDAATGKAVALDVLSSALGAGSGTDEITRRERGAYGAATNALNEDKSTRALRVYMNEQILPRLQGKLYTCTIKYRILLGLEIFLAIISVIIFTLLTTTELEETVKKVFQECLGVKVGLSAISLVSTLLLLFISRLTGGLNELIKRLKREIMKRQTYNHVAKAMEMETQTHGVDASTRESSLRNAVWISATGKTMPFEGWQLQEV
ncbi:NS3 [CHeRI orbivirus 2-1]|nr:NS3 [CHeRI orbivirus 2-1]